MKQILIIVGILGIFGVVLGAIGAHSLKPYLNEVQFNSFETGVRYHFIHTLAILMMGILYHVTQNIHFKNIAYIFFYGILFFSGSIYLLATKDLTGLAGLKSILGPITPVGGLIFIGAWSYLIYTAIRMKSN